MVTMPRLSNGNWRRRYVTSRRRKTPYAKDVYGGKSSVSTGGRRRSRTLRTRVKKIEKAIEKKQYTALYPSVDIGTPGNIMYLNCTPIPRGTTVDERVGNRFCVKYIRVKLYIVVSVSIVGQSTAPSSVPIRFVLIHQKDGLQGFALSPEQYFDGLLSNYPMIATKNYNQKKSCRFVFDRIVDIPINFAELDGGLAGGKVLGTANCDWYVPLNDMEFTATADSPTTISQFQGNRLILMGVLGWGATVPVTAQCDAVVVTVFSDL